MVKYLLLFLLFIFGCDREHYTERAESFLKPSAKVDVIYYQSFSHVVVENEEGARESFWHASNTHAVAGEKWIVEPYKSGLKFLKRVK